MPERAGGNCVKNDMESLGLSQKDAQSRNKWRRRIKGATQVHLEKWPLKRCVCVGVCVCDCTVHPIHITFDDLE